MTSKLLPATPSCLLKTQPTPQRLPAALLLHGGCSVGAKACPPPLAMCQVDIKKSYHCSAECLREHWAFHRDFHQQSRENGGCCRRSAPRGGRLEQRCCQTAAAAAAAVLQAVAACRGNRLKQVLGVALLAGRMAAATQQEQGQKQWQLRRLNWRWQQYHGYLVLHSTAGARCCQTYGDCCGELQLSRQAPRAQSAGRCMPHPRGEVSLACGEVMPATHVAPRPSVLPAGDNSFPRVDGFKGSYTYSNSGETWVEVRPLCPLPAPLAALRHVCHVPGG